MSSLNQELYFFFAILYSNPCTHLPICVNAPRRCTFQGASPMPSAKESHVDAPSKVRLSENAKRPNSFVTQLGSCIYVASQKRIHMKKRCALRRAHPVRYSLLNCCAWGRGYFTITLAVLPPFFTIYMPAERFSFDTFTP